MSESRIDVILLYTVVLGVCGALLRARMSGTEFALPPIRGEWLILLAVLPQLIVFFLPGVQRFANRELAATVLVASQIFLLVFVWLNRSYSPFLVLGVGLLLNFLVILTNGGLMPISPETVALLDPEARVEWLEIGQRLGGSKNVLLPAGETRLPILSDQFILPSWFPHRVALSIGDILIAIGVVWFFWKGIGIAQED